MKNFLCALMVCTSIHGHINGQTVTPQVVNSTGSSFRNDNYIIEWSIGEMAVVAPMQASNANGNYIFSNGFLQPFASFFKPTEKTFGINDIRILPNPTPDKVEIDFQVFEQGRMKLFLCDAMGRALYSREFVTTGVFYTEKINLAGFTNGTYLLQVTLTSDSDPIPVTRGVYKIIKL